MHIDPHRKSIWLVTARVGAGHVQAAKAIEEELIARGLGDRVQMIDIMDWVPAWFRKLYAGGYAWLAAHAPKLYGRLFWATDSRDSLDPTLSERMRIFVEGLCIRSLRSKLLEDQPEWIIHTHFLAPHVMSRWIAAMKLKSKQLAVVTDIYPHRIWMNPAIDAYCVPTEVSLARLTAEGIHRDRIMVSGIPLLAKHRLPTNKAATFQEFKWPADRRVILLLSGSDFMVGPIKKIAVDILDTFPDVTLQVAAGNNQGFRREMEELTGTHSNLRVIGYCDKMQELFCAADIVISKSGGITTSECLAHGAALIALFPVPGQEEHNADYLVSNSAGIKVTNKNAVTGAIKDLLESPEALPRMRLWAAKLGKPRAAEAVVNRVLG